MIFNFFHEASSWPSNSICFDQIIYLTDQNDMAFLLLKKKDVKWHEKFTWKVWC